jgi:hypothetical protein
MPIQEDELKKYLKDICKTIKNQTGILYFEDESAYFSVSNKNGADGVYDNGIVYIISTANQTIIDQYTSPIDNYCNLSGNHPNDVFKYLNESLETWIILQKNHKEKFQSWKKERNEDHWVSKWIKTLKVRGIEEIALDLHSEIIEDFRVQLKKYFDGFPYAPTYHEVIPHIQDKILTYSHLAINNTQGIRGDQPQELGTINIKKKTKGNETSHMEACKPELRSRMQNFLETLQHKEKDRFIDDKINSDVFIRWNNEGHKLNWVGEIEELTYFVELMINKFKVFEWGEGKHGRHVRTRMHFEFTSNTKDKEKDINQPLRKGLSTIMQKTDKYRDKRKKLDDIFISIWNQTKPSST